MKRFVMDVGNRNMKFGYQEGENLIKYTFQNIFQEQYEVNHAVEEVVEVENKFYCMNKGSYDFEFNKSKKNYVPAMLKGIAMKTIDEEIELMLSCPAEQAAGLREAFKEMLLNKTFEFKYKNVPRKVKFVNVGVIGEGFATFFALPKEVRKNKNVGIIDIGGRTINVVTFKKGILDTQKSYNYGALDLKTKVLEEQRLLGNDIDLLEVEERIEMGKVKIDEKLKENFINRFLNDIKMDKIKFDMFDWYTTGGGSIDLSETIEKLIPEAEMLEDPLFSNVDGMGNFASAKWGEV